jgi:hypothetical protein
MRTELKKMFRVALRQELVPLGYIKESDTIFAREFFPGVLGCIGYLTAGFDAIKPFVGVQFEHVERLHEEMVRVFRVGNKSTPRYFPTVWRDLYDLKKEQSHDPDFMRKESQYLKVELETVSQVAKNMLTDIRQCGTSYIAFNTTLTNAAATMVDGRGGGIGTVAYKLPIIYWMLGRTNEAKSYMAITVAKGYPIGSYAKYIALVTARMEAGRAPPAPNLH